MVRSKTSAFTLVSYLAYFTLMMEAVLPKRRLTFKELPPKRQHSSNKNISEFVLLNATGRHATPTTQ
jgi:hypothetical protein